LKTETEIAYLRETRPIQRSTSSLFAALVAPNV
jgi:hypothetical protein